MRYYVTLGDSEIPVEISPLPDGTFDVHLNGDRVEADIEPLPDALSIRIGNRVVDLTIEGEPPELGAVANGLRLYAKVESERFRAVSAARGGKEASGQTSIVSPMPGRIVKVLVEQGAEVQTGDAVVVVEAMKMENELRAPQAGTIANICVKVGDRVEGGAKLVEFS